MLKFKFSFIIKLDRVKVYDFIFKWKFLDLSIKLPSVLTAIFDILVNIGVFIIEVVCISVARITVKVVVIISVVVEVLSIVVVGVVGFVGFVVVVCFVVVCFIVVGFAIIVAIFVNLEFNSKF